MVDSKFGEGIARGTEGVLLENQRRRRERANRPATRRRQQCWKATEPWHREPEAGVITAWLAAACTCAGRSMAGSLAGLLTCSPIVHQRHARACSKSSTTALFGPTAARGQQSSVLRAMAMGQMLATTHGQSYRAQSLWCEGVGGLWNCPLMTPYTARGFCHAVVLCLCQV